MQRSTRVKLLLIVAVITLLVRLPFFCRDVVDPDEGTFVLMGQDILDGNLPYDKLWDLKPPLLFCFFAATIAVFGKSIPAVRFGGFLCALAAAWLIFLCAERVGGTRAGFMAALLFIFTSTLSESGAGAVSEIVAVVPLSSAMLVLLKDEVRWKDFFLAGLFISLACLIRLNLCYVALATGLVLPSGRFFRPRAGFWARICGYAAGGVVPVLLAFIPYVLAGKERLFSTAMIDAPLSYANSQMSMLASMLKYMHTTFEPRFFMAYFPVLICLVCGTPLYLHRIKKIPVLKKSLLATPAVLGAATAVSILKSGPAFEHYLIQLLPFAAVICAFFIDCALETRWKPFILALSILYMVAPLGRIAHAYEPVLSRAMAGERLVYGPAYEIARYLKKVNPDNKPVYFMGAQMSEWLLGVKPICKEATTPSNISREYLMKSLDGPSATASFELAAILRKKPVFIVKPAAVWYLMAHPRASELLSQELFKNYEPIREIGEYVIFKRF